MGKNKGRQSFLAGATILALSVVLVKVIGAVYKVMLANVLGGVGNGIFTAAYELYIPLYTLATAGFPIALSRMVSESIALGRYKDVKRIYNIACPFFICAGIIAFGLMICLSWPYAHFIKAPEVIYAVWTLAPTILFGCLVSIYRGYYEGMSNMFPTAISEIIEAIIKLVIGLSLAKIGQKYMLEEYTNSGTVFGKIMETQLDADNTITAYTVAIAIFGITLGAVFSFLFVYLRYKLGKNDITKEQYDSSPEPRRKKDIFSQLVRTALPIGLGAIVMSVAGSIDSNLILIRIDALVKDPQKLSELIQFYGGNIYEEVIKNGNIHKFLSGCYSYSLTLMMLVTSITQVFGTSALPNVTRSYTRNDKTALKKDIETVIKITTVFTFPAGLGLSIFSKEILSLLYSSPAVACEVEIAAKALQILGITVIFTAVSTPLCSLLQAVGRADLPLKLFLVSSAINIILNYTLIIIPQLNIIGAAIGTLAAYIFVCFAAIYKLCRETKIIPDFVSIIIKPLFSATICALTAYGCNLFIRSFVNQNLSTIVSIVIAGIVYLFVLLLTGAFTKNDIIMLPNGKNILKTLEKCRIIR